MFFIEVADNSPQEMDKALNQAKSSSFVLLPITTILFLCRDIDNFV